MYDVERLMKIIDTLHENGNNMELNNLRSELELSQDEFLFNVEKLKDMGYLREIIDKKSLKNRIFLTDEGIKL
jgi:predicted transcriptional regulator